METLIEGIKLKLLESGQSLGGDNSNTKRLEQRIAALEGNRLEIKIEDEGDTKPV
jgi:hypothetical protein